MNMIHEKIFSVEEFLFPETCEMLVSIFSNSVIESDIPGIYGGPGRGENDKASDISGLEKIKQKSPDERYNIGIDIFTGICSNIEKTSSILFKKDLVLKSYFYSHMKSGGKNPLHIDNHSEEYMGDHSVILYLNKSYTGGMLNFPKQGIKLKPEPGTLIAFIGTEDLEHEVEEVLDGDRVNIICFLTERNK